MRGPARRPGRAQRAEHAGPGDIVLTDSGSGQPTNGKAFTGHYNVAQFVTRNGKTYAVGTLTGRLGNRTIKRTNVVVPTSMGGTTRGMARSAQTTCQILNLVLGPLHLNAICSAVWRTC